ncbi:hypothetical protein HKD37_01G000253 [Glycine soja]
MTHQAVIIVVIINVAIHFPHGMGSCRTSDFSMMWFQFGIKLMGPLFSLFSVQDQDYFTVYLYIPGVIFFYNSYMWQPPLDLWSKINHCRY